MRTEDQIAEDLAVEQTEAILRVALKKGFSSFSSKTATLEMQQKIRDRTEEILMLLPPVPPEITLSFTLSPKDTGK